MPKRIEPGPDQESVWDYPRPPKLEKADYHIEIWFNGKKIADTTDAYRVLETSHPPTYYLPPEDLAMEHLEQAPGKSLCEWKGQAKYYDVVVDGQRATKAGWYYPNPTDRFKEIAGYVAFYAQKVDRCMVDGEEAEPQPGGFYGGWVTSHVVGPFKGEPGTMGW